MSFSCRVCRCDFGLKDLSELSCNCLVCVICSRASVEQQLFGRGIQEPAKPQYEPSEQEIDLGDEVLYRTADGQYVEAVVEIVDISVQPPQYGIQVCGSQNLRFTERHRLSTSKPGTRTIPQTYTGPVDHLRSVRCACCSTPLSLPLLRALAPDVVASWEAERTASWLRVNDIIKCPHPSCGALIQRIAAANSTTSSGHPAGPDTASPFSPLTNHLNQQRNRHSQSQAPPQQNLTPGSTAAAHRERHRYRCGACSRDFCDACMAAPYHTGLTCQQARAPDCLLCGGKVHENYLQQLLPVAAAKGTAGKGRQRQGLAKGLKDGASGGHQGSGSGDPDGAVADAREVAAAASRTELLKALRDKLQVDTTWCLERRDLERSFLHWGCRTCHDPACATKRRDICSRLLPCGHWCCGLRGEGEGQAHPHPRCVECGADPSGASGSGGAAAAAAPASALITECCFCWEPLVSAPCVEMACGALHVCHLHCARGRLEAGYPGPHISFTHLYCPLCRSADGSAGGAAGGSGAVQSALASVHLEHPALATALAPHLELRSAVVAAARARMRMDPALKSDPELQPGGRYDGRPADFGLERLLFYKCSKCTKPYYGGMRACGAAGADPAEQQAGAAAGAGPAGGQGGARAGGGGPAAGNNNNADQQLMCGECCARASGTNCPRHGTQYIEWKCRYCCSLASWFCFGTTHFCQPCHANVAAAVQKSRNAGSGTVCTDPKCTLKDITHPPPGNEACLGCGMCRGRL